MILRKYITIILLLLCVSLIPAFAEAIEANALLSIYERLNIGKTCRELGFSNCKFVIKDNDEENAYVTGDWNIYIHTQLLRNVKSEDELAFIIAHEIGHLIYAYPRKRGEDVGWIELGNSIAQIFVKKDDTKMLIDSVSSAITSTYTKEQEREADRYAIYTVYNVGYDPLKAVNFFYRQMNSEGKIKAKLDRQKAELEMELYQSDSTISQLKAYLDQALRNTNKAKQIYEEVGFVSAYNQWVRFANYYNSLVAQYNRAANYHNSLMKDYKQSVYNFLKALSPLFRTHPVDEERITTIVNITNDLIQRKQSLRKAEEKFRKTQSEWRDFLKEKSVE